MTQKSTKLSQEQKEEIKEIVKPIKKGTEFLGAVDVETLEIAEKVRKTKVPYEEIVKALNEGKAYQFKGSRNAVNAIMIKIENKYSIKAVFAKLKNGNFAIFKKKE